MGKVTDKFMDSKKLLEKLRQCDEQVVFITPRRAGKTHFMEQWKKQREAERVKRMEKIEMVPNFGKAEGNLFQMIMDKAVADADERCKEKLLKGEETIDLRKVAEAVHKNAVAHGWWDEKRKPAAIRALINSEWSEALEEARAGRPMVWRECLNTKAPCMQEGCGDWEDGKCALDELAQKPEGIAVELMDGCIRILDYMFCAGMHSYTKFTVDHCVYLAHHFPDENIRLTVEEADFETIVDTLEYCTANARGLAVDTYLLTAIGIAFVWVRCQGLSPEVILLEKHNYNKTRPYKHGKKF